MTVMFYNTENLFDTDDDPLKDDDAFTPNGDYRWTRPRYWNKLDAISKVIVAADEDMAPALVGLCEVENETVLTDLTSRSALRQAGYRFVMTDSPDRRGIDVALLYEKERMHNDTSSYDNILTRLTAEIESALGENG